MHAIERINLYVWGTVCATKPQDTPVVTMGSESAGLSRSSLPSGNSSTSGHSESLVTQTCREDLPHVRGDGVPVKF